MPWEQGAFIFETALPGSKSLTLRDCAIAALADGASTIRYPGECDDYWRMKDCLRRLGIAVDNSAEDAVRITGRNGDFAVGPIDLNTGQSAVSTRLLLAMAALRPDPTTIDGHISMRNRPNKALVDALASLGARLQSTNDGHLPTTVIGTRQLRGPVRVPSNISSQYLTSLLIIAPLLESGLIIEVEGELTSKPYVDLTLDEMAKFGVRVVNHDYRRLAVAPQVYRASDIDVEGDASAASYFAALATLHGARITLSNLGSGTRQGDYAFFGLCEQLGARVERTPSRTVIEGPRKLAGGFDADVDMTSMPDVAPTLMMLAPFLSRPTRITGLATLRVKECDRIAAPTRELRKLGVTVEEGAGLHGHRAARRGSIHATCQLDTDKCGNRDLSRPPHRHVLRRARIAACRACGFSIRAASRRLIRTSGETGNSHEASREANLGRRRFGGVKSGA